MEKIYFLATKDLYGEFSIIQKELSVERETKERYYVERINGFYNRYVIKKDIMKPQREYLSCFCVESNIICFEKDLEEARKKLLAFYKHNIEEAIRRSTEEYNDKIKKHNHQMDNFNKYVSSEGVK